MYTYSRISIEKLGINRANLLSHQLCEPQLRLPVAEEEGEEDHPVAAEGATAAEDHLAAGYPPGNQRRRKWEQRNS